MRRLELYGRRPIAPAATHGTAEFEAGLRAGRPEFARCADCGRAAFPRPMRCGCGGRRFTAEPMPETGDLHSATTIHAAPGALARLAPYRVGLVDLGGEVRLLLRLFGPEAWAPTPGDAVELLLAEYEDGPVLAACPRGLAPGDIVHEPRGRHMPGARPDTTRAIVARKGPDGTQTVGFEELALADLPDGDVLVRVEYTGLNYKDALALTASGPIVRTFPMVLGVDLAGTVVDSRSPRFRPGDIVIVNGYGLSETRWGGYAQYQSLPEKVVTPLPKGFTAEQAMQIGTAGYTAMLCVQALTDHGLDPAQDAVLVTGAAGGVGSIAVLLLARLGFNVIAVTGRETQHGFLHRLGARDVISRTDLATGGKALGRERWAGAIDVAGGETLAHVVAQTRYDGIVACCGMAGGGELPATVYPFILRGVTLRGVDSVMVPQARRLTAWERLDELLDRVKLAELSATRDFDDLPELGRDLLAGRLHGRIAIRVPH